MKILFIWYSHLSVAYAQHHIMLECKQVHAVTFTTASHYERGGS